MAIQEERMRENEELFRTLNERLVEQVADTLEDDRVVPFLCECADDLCMARMEMTLARSRTTASCRSSASVRTTSAWRAWR